MAAAGNIEALKNEVVCAICLDFFKDPVTVDCGHNFCRDCIAEFWEKSDSAIFCPKCRELFKQKKNLRQNKDLANIVEEIKKLNVCEPKPADNFLCEEHDEKLKLFCEDDEVPICVVCGLSRDHKNHNVIPMKEAVTEYRGKLQQSLENLKLQLENIARYQSDEETKLKKIKASVESERQRIVTEFEDLHQFLNNEKQILFTKLESEEDEMVETVKKNLKTLSEQSSSLSSLITDIEGQMKLQDTAFLKAVRGALNRCTVNIQEMPMTSEFTLNGFGSPLQYFVWKKMLPIIKPAPAPLTLDPKTANPLLILSEDRTTVKCGRTKQSIPDNPERFNCYQCVLTSDGFNSGRHYWEVEGKDGTDWYIGAVSESAARKGDITLLPKDGYWIVVKMDGDIRKIGVYLDYEGGQLSFYNAETMSHLHTYNHPFSEKIFPFFWVYDIHSMIKVCHLHL
ncbi:E3 ubiquitin-protein ligase TRIM39-like [Protopterus annectens]|uniref:E3 ubiquitin-protein ligase TRIM39-like n=1 Tax=Protopterus annectens TaxID=7888 RepID=UPI001CFC3A50|nr:E3 ubiquitin-protein ligase TRIM39-like [Protopterus annectens]